MYSHALQVYGYSVEMRLFEFKDTDSLKVMDDENQNEFES
jgi:hypothetical protein